MVRAAQHLEMYRKPQRPALPGLIRVLASAWLPNLRHGAHSGIGSLEPRPAPTRVVLPLPAQAIVAGEWHSCALLSNQSLRCWGHFLYGQIGTGQLPSWGDGVPASESPPSRYASPQHVALAVPTRKLVAADSFTCALGIDGRLRCCGGGLVARHLVGTPDTIAVPTPTVVSHPILLKDVAADSDSLCVLDEKERTLCWGALLARRENADHAPYEVRWDGPEMQIWPSQATEGCPSFR